MIDIETLGKKTNAVIFQIGAVEFCPDTFRTGREFSIDIDPRSARALGLRTEEQTVQWHKDRGTHVKDLKGTSVHHAFQQFIHFLTEEISPEQYWCKSTSFDFPRLEDVFGLIGGTPPWKYWQLNDMRTIWNKAFPGKRTPEADHTALEDCRKQIEQLAEANERITERAIRATDRSSAPAFEDLYNRAETDGQRLDLLELAKGHYLETEQYEEAAEIRDTQKEIHRRAAFVAGLRGTPWSAAFMEVFGPFPPLPPGLMRKRHPGWRKALVHFPVHG